MSLRVDPVKVTKEVGGGVYIGEVGVKVSRLYFVDSRVFLLSKSHSF